MRIAGIALPAASIGLLIVAFGGAGSAAGHEGRHRGAVRVTTDGRLRPGHLETIRVSGFPGKGLTEVSFFPTAICEEECGARNIPGGPTDARGAGRLRVRVPETFTDHRGRPTYFRDGERIDVEVTWEGPDHSFAHGSAEPEPIIVRVHGRPRG